MFRTGSCFAVLVVLVAAGHVKSAPIEWPVAAGGNGHYYELVDPPGGINWTDAKWAAENHTFMGTPGHLATTTSQEEWDFVVDNFAYEFSWIGLSDAAQEGNFQWVTGETLQFSAWWPGEPNDTDGNEDYVNYASLYGVFGWNDFPNKASFSNDNGYFELAYLIEYPVPEPSVASFASTLETVHNIDFGTLIQGDPSPAEPFEIWNIADPVSGADLDLLNVTGSGDASLLTTDLSPFTDLAPGSSNLFTASMDTSTAGDFSATYALSFSDELGTDQLLVLNLSGSVVPEPSTVVLLLTGAVVLFAWRRRRTHTARRPEPATHTREVL